MQEMFFFSVINGFLCVQEVSNSSVIEKISFRGVPFLTEKVKERERNSANGILRGETKTIDDNVYIRDGRFETGVTLVLGERNKGLSCLFYPIIKVFIFKFLLVQRLSCFSLKISQFKDQFRIISSFIEVTWVQGSRKVKDYFTLLKSRGNRPKGGRIDKPSEFFRSQNGGTTVGFHSGDITGKVLVQ